MDDQFKQWKKESENKDFRKKVDNVYSHIMLTQADKDSWAEGHAKLKRESNDKFAKAIHQAHDAIGRNKARNCKLKVKKLKDQLRQCQWKKKY